MDGQALIPVRVRVPLHSLCASLLSRNYSSRVLTVVNDPQRPKGRDGLLAEQ